MPSDSEPVSTRAIAGEEIRQFTAALTHSIANIFSSLLMNAELGRMYVARSQPERASLSLDRLAEDCSRANGMIADLQRFASVLAPVALRSASLRDCWRDAQEQLLGASGATFVLDSAGVDDEVDATVTLVLVELLQNAVDAGARQIKAVLSSGVSGRELIISDDGHGMASEIAARLPQAFFSTRRDQGHTGLGLCIASHLLTRSGASLAIDDTPGKGARVSLALPLVRRT